MNRKNVLVALAGLAMSGVAFAQDSTGNQDRAYAAEMMADAQTRTSLLQAGGSGHDGAFNLSDASGNYRLNIGGFTQFRYYLNFRDGDVGGGGHDSGFTNGFEATRTDLIFSGNVINPNTTFYIRTEFNSNGDFDLLDAYGKYAFDNGTGLIWGQYRAPVFRETLVAETGQLTAEYSLTGTVFDPDRTQGIAVDYRGDSFYGIFSFNDGGDARNSSYSGTGEADYGLTARVEGKLAGEWNRFDDFTSFRNQDFAALIGGAVHYQQTGNTAAFTSGNVPAFQTQGNAFLYTVDASLEGNGWNVYGAFLGLHSDPDAGSSVDNFGGIIQGGIFVTDNVELFGRWDGLFADEDLGGITSDGDDNLNTFTVGVNNYFVPDSHAAKLTVDLQYLVEQPSATAFNLGGINSTNNTLGLLPDSDDGQFAIRIQMQLMF
jgi:hypothetical protein